MVKSLREFEYFTVFLKNRNFTSKIKRSKITDYAALNTGIIPEAWSKDTILPIYKNKGDINDPDN